MGDGPLEHLHRPLPVRGEHTGDEGRVQCYGHGQGVEGLEDGPVHLHGRAETHHAGGGGLALGKAVDHVVVDDVGNVHVATDGVDEVVASLAVHVPVARLGDHHHLRVDCLDQRGGGQRPTVQAVEVVGLEVLGRLRGLPDAGHHHHASRFLPQLRQGLLDVL